MPAPEPPNSTGTHRPSSPASRNASKMSVGVRALFVDGPGPWLDLVPRQTTDRVAQVQKFVGEFEIHP